MDSEDFTRGRFDTSESLAESRHHGHGKRHHKLAQHRSHHSAPKVQEPQQVAHVDA